MRRLEDAQPGADGRRVGEDEDLPAVGGRMRRDEFLEPLELLLVDGDLVARVLGGAEDRGACRRKARQVGDVGGGGPLEQPSQELGAPWPRRLAWRSAWTCLAAQSRQAPPDRGGPGTWLGPGAQEVPRGGGEGEGRRRVWGGGQRERPCCGAEADEQGLLGDLPLELHGRFACEGG